MILAQALSRGGGAGVTARLDLLANPGRSSRYSARRHRAARRRLYEQALSARGRARHLREAAVAGRLLALLGRTREAELALRRAAAEEPRSAEASAWLWELRWAGRPIAPLRGLDDAVRLDPSCALWRAWRGLARLRPEGATTRAQAAAALEDFDQALALGGGALAAAGRGLALRAAGQPLAAAEALGAAIALEPAEGWLHHLRARCRLSAGDLQGFLADCERSIMLDEALGDLANAFGSMRGYEPARLEDAATRWLARDPRAYWALALRGDCRRSRGRGDAAGALADHEAAAQLAPRCAWAWAYLGRARQGCGDGEGAAQALERAVSLAPECGWILAWLGELRRRAGMTAQALADLDAGLQRSPDYEPAYGWRGAARLSAERPDALEDLDLAAALSPDNAWVLHQRSLALRAQGRTGEALEALEAARRLDPKFSWCGRAETLGAAAAELDAWLSRRPRDPLALRWRGETRRSLGDAAGAERDWRRAAALEPHSALTRVWLGRLLLETGRSAEGLRHLERAVLLDPRSAEALAWRGRALAAAGRLAPALADLRRASRLEPTAAWIFRWLGELELSLGRPASARRSLSRCLSLNPGDAQARAALEAA